MMTVKTNGSSSNYEDQYGVESNFDTTQLWASQEEKTLRRNGSYLSLNKLKRFSIFHGQLTYTITEPLQRKAQTYVSRLNDFGTNTER